MIEEQTDTRAQNTAMQLIFGVHSLVRSLALYDANNDAIKRVMDAILEALDGYFAEVDGEQIRLQLLEDEFFVNGKLLKLDAKSYERAKALADFLIKHELGELVFYRGMTREQLETFARDLGETVRTGSNRLNPAGYGALTLDKSVGQSVSAFRFQPDKLAIYVYGGLLDLVDRLYFEHRAGRSPSLLLVRRTLQLVIDAMKEHSGIYQMVAAIRDPENPIDVTRQRVATAVEAIGFGYYLGLEALSLMSLALGALLTGLSSSPDPDEAVEPLYRFAGLGDAAMPLTLAVHDCRAARQGKPAGVPGRMLAISEIYVALTSATEERPAMAPPRAIQAMLKGEAGAEQGPARLFADFKGPYPLGSLLKLSNGRTALVVSHGKGAQGKQRPIVALLTADSKVGKTLDLAEHPELTIESTPAYSDIGFNLARA